ncbi:MAG: zinc ABC transporter substrate-binding protein [Chlamydiia bacterium]|nr:zinc ABC transporter substrate-binding protein [Chlamydiia bacterium]
MKRLLSLALLIFFTFGCQSPEKKVKEQPLVVTSIPPYVSIVKAIVGNTMEVKSALGIDFDPHVAEPTPREMKMVQDADLFIGVGEAYEYKLVTAIQEGVRKVEVLELDEETPLLSYSQDTHFGDVCRGGVNTFEGTKDLHFWLSPRMLIIQVNILVDALTKMKSENGEVYRENGNMLIEKLKELDHQIEEKLHPYQNRAIIVSHPALGYYCHDYHLIQIAIECEGKSPLPKNVHHILDLAKSSNPICALTAPQFNNRGAEMIAEKLNLRVESFNPMGEYPLQTLQQLTDAITDR